MTDGRMTDAGGADTPRPNFVFIMADHPVRRRPITFPKLLRDADLC